MAPFEIMKAAPFEYRLCIGYLDVLSEVDPLARSVSVIADEFVGVVIVDLGAVSAFERILTALGRVDEYRRVIVGIGVFALFLSII